METLPVVDQKLTRKISINLSNIFYVSSLIISVYLNQYITFYVLTRALCSLPDIDSTEFQLDAKELTLKKSKY